MVRLLRIITVALMPLTGLSLVGMAIQEREPGSGNVFEEPARRMQAAQLQLQMIGLYTSGRHHLALDLAGKILELTPNDPAACYNAACLYALDGKPRESLQNLEKAVEFGFRNPEQILKDRDLADLRDEPEFLRIVERSRQPFELPADDPERTVKPGSIADGVAMVSPENTCWVRSRGVLVTYFEKAAADLKAEAVSGKTDAEKLVQQWYREGTAAGHAGDLYDNRDRGHSSLNLKKFPQLTAIKYGPEAREVRFDWGVQIHQLFDHPVLGNSSTAQVGTALWRSNPRLFLYSDAHTKRLYNQYVNNHLYVYPEHNDFDVTHGDVYPANMPFCVISQGSSGSDQPFLEALALTMAAFRPAVKQKLVEQGMLMPTLQAILRRSCRSVASDEDYLSGKAHPIVFQSSELDPVRMVEMARGMETANYPPMIQLRVLEEDMGVPGRDYFYPGPGERLFDTPAAIARLYRTVAAQRRMVVDASASRDLSQQPLTFRWVLLQGDPSLVQIRPLDESASRAEIIIRWHPRVPSAGRPEILSSRVDIGVFARNERYYSAPGIVSSFTFNNEKREYDAQGRIQSVDYADPEIGRNYVDPLLDLKKSWRDDFRYSPDGQPVGWTRHMSDGKVREFNHDGTLVLERDALGRAVKSRVVRYQAADRVHPPGRLEFVETDQTVTYVYESDQDWRGTAKTNP